MSPTFAEKSELPAETTRSTTSTGLDTAWRPTTLQADPDPRALERRLFISYLMVFATAFIIAALVVRFSFVTVLEQQTTTRLQILARAGLRSTIAGADHLAIDTGEIANTRLLSPDQGLQWYDLHGRLLASEGVTPRTAFSVASAGEVTRADQDFVMLAIPILKPKTHTQVGTVRASEMIAAKQANIRGFDVGLLIGTLLAIVGGGIAGLMLTRNTVRPVARAFETLRDFTADASHELRGPLTAIAANADAALRDAEPAAAGDRSRFQAIADSAKHLSRLTSDLLLIANAERSLERDMFVVDLAALVDSLVTRYRTQFASADITIRPAIERGVVVYGNPDQIERILANLIENAVRYSPPGSLVLIDSERSRTQVFIAVRDNGIGIAPEHIDRVFDRFWRVRPTHSSGTGLGLAIARALARRHGGDVSVSSHVGVGSEFVVSFPTRPPNLD